MNVYFAIKKYLTVGKKCNIYKVICEDKLMF